MQYAFSCGLQRRLMPKKNTRTVNVEATFSMVVKLNEDTDLLTMLRDNTEYLAEPKNADGCVIAMRFKKMIEK